MEVMASLLSRHAAPKGWQYIALYDADANPLNDQHEDQDLNVARLPPKPSESTHHPIPLPLPMSSLCALSA